MHGPRHQSKKRPVIRGRLVLVVAIALVICYGFFIQTRDFHPQGGFQAHRKNLRELESMENEVIKSEMKAEGGGQGGGSIKPLVSQITDIHVTVTENDDSEARKAVQGLPIKFKERDESTMQALITNSEMELDHLYLQKKPDSKETKAFQPLPPVAAEKQQAAEVGRTGVPTRPHGGVTVESATTEEEWRERQEAVKTAAQESWAAYEQYAMGQDELKPLSLTGKKSFGDMGITLVDSLDTLWMMGLKAEFDRARKWVSEELNFDKPAKLSLFETTIRMVGGLLSAYDLSNDRLFLDKAQKLVDLLMPVFDTASTGIPNNVVYINQGGDKNIRITNVGRAAIAEFGSLQVEFVALSQRTSQSRYGDKAEAIMRHLHNTYPDVGLLPVWFNRRQGTYSKSNLYTVGAMADSFFEYLLKLWLLHQKQEEMYRAMWEKATDEALEKLVAVSAKGLTFIGQRRHVGGLIGKMEHLACYFPGNLALGVAQGAVTGAKAQHYLEVAANLTYTCWQMYNSTATGLGMDLAEFNSEGDMQVKVKYNMLRPETVESLFYLWRVTGEPKYREWGWSIFEAFQTHSRTPSGAYASVENVDVLPVKQQDGMESFWLAETLKYLWLLFGSDDLLSLDDWVLNTEAHPFRIALPLR